MLHPSWDDLRLFLHVLAATIWVGGQFTVAGLVPVLRTAAPEATTAVARQFGRLAWPAYGVLVATGLWNVSSVGWERSSPAWHATFFLKLGVVALAGVAAFAHQRAASPRGLAVWGGISALSSLAALFVGIMLTR